MKIYQPQGFQPCLSRSSFRRWYVPYLANERQRRRNKVFGRTFYVDSVAGDNANSGLSIDAPWQTFANVSTLDTGDTLLLKRDSVFTQRLVLPAKRDLTVAAYGSGAKPLINGLVDIRGTAGSTWTNQGSSRWSRTVTGPGTWGGFYVVFNGEACRYHQDTAAAVITADDFNFNSGTNTVTIFSTPDPATAFSSLQIVPQTFSSQDCGLFVDNVGECRNAANWTGLSVSDVAIRGFRTGLLVSADADLTNVDVRFTSGAGFIIAGGGNYSMTGCRGWDTGSSFSSGEHAILFVGSGAANVKGVTGDWTNQGSNVWSRSLAAIGSPAGNHRVRDVMDFPAKRLCKPATSIAGVNTPNTWFVLGNTLYVYSTSNPASAFTTLEGATFETLNAVIDGCEFDNAGEDALQIAGITAQSQVLIRNSRIGRGFENSVDIKCGDVTLEGNWIYHFTRNTAERGPTITAQGLTKRISMIDNVISCLLTDKGCYTAQEYRCETQSQRNIFFGASTSNTGLVGSNFNGSVQSFSFDVFFNYGLAGSVCPEKPFSGKSMFRHCLFSGETTGGSSIGLGLGISNFTTSLTSITVDTANVINIAGTEYYQAIAQWDGTEIYAGPGAKIHIDSLTGQSAALNGDWRVREDLDNDAFEAAWYAKNGVNNTRSFSKFLVPVVSNPPASVDLTGKQVRLYPEVLALEGNTFRGKTEIVIMIHDLATPTASIPVRFSDVVSQPLGANYWAQHATSNNRLIRLAKNGATQYFTATQIMSDTMSAGNLKFETGGIWGGSANKADISTLVANQAYEDIAVSSVTISGEVATITCLAAHYLTIDKFKKVVLYGATVPSGSTETAKIDGAYFIESIPNSTTLTIRTCRGVANGSATLSSAFITAFRPKTSSQGYQTAPVYSFPADQLDVHGNAVPASNRSFGPVQAV